MDARLLVGEGAPLVRLRWLYTEQRFKPPGSPTFITNRIWDEDQVTDLVIGQVQPEVANYVQDARWHLPPGLRPGHTCHPEWMATGEPYPNDLPPNVYGPNQIPECCGLFERAVALPVNVNLRTAAHFYPPTALRLPVNVNLRTTAHHYPTTTVALPVSVNLRTTAHHYPTTTVALPVNVNLRTEASYDGASGVWIRDVAGEYVFTATFTGWHLVRLVGAGGGGANATSPGGMDASGGGGGGGAEANSVLWLTAGVDYNSTVGAGGSPGGGDGGGVDLRLALEELITAPGGEGATDLSGGAGGDASLAIGDQRWAGGNGADGGATDPGGGGGSSGCYSPSSMPPGTGGDGVGSSGGVPPLVDGGPGGDGGDLLNGGFVGGYSGGGGGGAGAGATDLGGAGWDGRIVIIWPAP